MAGKKLWVGIVFSRKVSNGQAAIEDLIARTNTKAGPDGEVVWAVDMTSGSAALLLMLLLRTGQRVLSVPGRLVNRMAGAFAGEAKTDARDAHTSPRPPGCVPTCPRSPSPTRPWEICRS